MILQANVVVMHSTWLLFDFGIKVKIFVLFNICPKGKSAESRVRCPCSPVQPNNWFPKSDEAFLWTPLCSKKSPKKISNYSLFSDYWQCTIVDLLSEMKKKSQYMYIHIHILYIITGLSLQIFFKILTKTSAKKKYFHC